MKLAVSLACLIILCSTAFVSADRNLVPTVENQPDVCLEQPPEPEWMQKIETRESHRRLLVQQIYRAQSMQRIVDAQDCACSTRYPSWKIAEKVFLEEFSDAEYRDVVEATSNYRQQANELRLEAMPICEAVGNW